jgi:hypothetical protein
MDVSAFFPNVLADDFLCTQSGYITNNHIWGSWLDDEEDPNPTFVLSIHSDVPADPDHPYSRPGPTLKAWTFLPGQYTVRLEQGGINEGWLTPPDTYVRALPPPSADTNCWQYNFHIPIQDAFYQTNGTVYWLDVQAKTTAGQRFGWKTTDPAFHWLDDAAWAVGLEPDYQGSLQWTNLTYPPGHNFYPQTLDLAFVLDGGIPPEEPPTPPAGPEPKWTRPLDTVNGLDVQSGERFDQAQFFPIIADDFVSDGRPITGIEWWGSYIGYGAGTNAVSGPPMAERPNGFRVRWYADIPAGVKTNYSLPGRILKQEYYPLSAWGITNGVLNEVYGTSVWHAWEGRWEHEFHYDLTLTNVWQEKAGGIYWLSVAAAYMASGLPPSNRWGWATTPPLYNFQDDAVVTNMMWPGWRPLVYTNLTPVHPYGDTSVNMAFSLLTDMQHRRGPKWIQPPDMRLGVNLDAYMITGMPMSITRADDFMSDGRRITDIHWWGSYLNYLTNQPGPVTPPPPGPYRPTGFWLSWHSDIPLGAGPNPWSMPGPPITNIFVPYSNCWEIYYGTVTQWWYMPIRYEHEFQYYVDLLREPYQPWYERSGTIYWLDITAVFTPFPGGLHNGWGWKTTPPTNRWNDFSVWRESQGDWYPGVYPQQHPSNNTPCDLAFELTTDEPGTGSNWWNQPIVLTNIALYSGAGRLVQSVGDVGAGVQVLQYSTNLLTTNWMDLVTNTTPLGLPFNNVWVDYPGTATARFYRVIQR